MADVRSMVVRMDQPLMLALEAFAAKGWKSREAVVRELIAQAVGAEDTRRAGPATAYKRESWRRVGLEIEKIKAREKNPRSGATSKGKRRPSKPARRPKAPARGGRRKNAPRRR